MPNLVHGIRPPALHLNRREEVVMARVRIGHMYMTQSYLFTEDKVAPSCDYCDVMLTIKHIIFDCPHHDNLRTQLKMSVSYEEVMSYDNSEKLLTFLNEIHLMHSI